MKESILKEKAMDFAIRIVNLYHFLNDKKQEKVMAKSDITERHLILEQTS